jgi:hypothetical protein
MKFESISSKMVDRSGRDVSIEISINESRQMGSSHDPRPGECFVYIWPEGETLLENLQNRRSRPYSYYKKEILPEINRLIEEFGMRIENFRWRQRLGCSCPCSPGFKTDLSMREPVFPPKLVMHVTIS